MSVTEEPGKPRNLQERLHIIQDRIYDRLFPNYVWQSIFRSGYPNAPRNQMLVVATNVFLHLHPTRLHRTHVKVTHTYCLGGLTFFMFLVLTITGVLLTFYYVPSVERAYQDIAALETNVKFGMLMRNMHRWTAHAMVILVFLHMMRVFYTGAEPQLIIFGGFEIGPNALIRFYTLHVLALPLMAAVFMAVHFWRIRRDGGMARPL